MRSPDARARRTEERIVGKYLVREAKAAVVALVYVVVL